MKQGPEKMTHHGKDQRVYHKGHVGAVSELGAEQVHLHGVKGPVTTKLGTDAPKSTTHGHPSGSQRRY